MNPFGTTSELCQDILYVRISLYQHKHYAHVQRFNLCFEASQYMSNIKEITRLKIETSAFQKCTGLHCYL